MARRRLGLADERSGLFMEAVRIIYEMKEATHDEYPKIAVWENVPGALSSAGGRDYQAVLEAFTKKQGSNASFWTVGKRRNGTRPRG